MRANKLASWPSLWGGIECSITRVKDEFQDQLKLAGHYERKGDIDLIAALGIRALRFPLLWEKHIPQQGMLPDWRWVEERLNILKEKNIAPIAGLVHHGSGPAYTNLMENSFATGLAEYAAKVASKFPEIEYYTPVNEPLTTARFSGLYGLWYPHRADDRSFCRMLINEIKAVVLSMQSIRKVNPHAKLIQTEDLAKIYASKNLQYQADFENERRWISFDLLCGRVDPDHFMWQYLVENGITKKELDFFLNNPCPPDILGLNYYVTSERYLDDNVNAYPPHMHGGNHIEKYVDTEAVRINHGQPSGLPILLREAQDRYSIPMAITEAHLHCTREEQMRWFRDTWQTCSELNENGCNIIAVTAWSLLGAFGWNKLLTSPDCDYEPGVFDLRGEKGPRATAVTEMIKSYAKGKDFSHPVLSQAGWWRRDDRFHAHAATGDTPSYGNWKGSDKILLITGQNILSDSIRHICDLRAIPYVHVHDVNTAVTKYKNASVWSLIHTETADQYEAGLLQGFCNSLDADLMLFAPEQTNLPNPEGRTLLIKHGILFSTKDTNDVAHTLLRCLSNGEPVDTEVGLPGSYSYVPDLVNTALDLLIDRSYGTYTLVHPERLTSSAFAAELCRRLGPETSSSNNQFRRHLQMMPSIYCALDHFVHQMKHQKRAELPQLTNSSSTNM